MEKKPKDPHTDECFNFINGDSNSDSASDSSNIFKTLFGDISEQNNKSVSVFSDDNPFRRKPIDRSQLGLGFGSAEEENKNPKFIEVKKRKRRENLIDEALEIKKLKMDDYKPKSSDFGVQDDEINHSFSFDLKESSKRGKGKVPKWGLESQEPLEMDKGKDPNLGFESDDMSNQENESVSLESNGIEEKKKKKRKRDEVEAAYEQRRYGVLAMSGECGEGRVVGVKRKKIDDPVDMVVLEKEGFDDDAKLLRTVFVGNLPLKVKKKVLFKEFSQFGEIESVRIQSIPLLDNKKPRMGAIIQKKINDAVDSVYAYIVFKTEESAQASLSHNMAVVGGNHIGVDRACPPRKKLKGENAPLYDNKRTVFVGNLPFDVKDEEIYQLFSGIKDVESSIEAIQVIRDPGTSVGKGVAYVLFKTRGTASLVVKKRSLKLQDRELRIHHARPNLTPSKRKSPRQRNDSPTKKLATDLRIPDSSNKVNTKAANSYQGLRASKQGVQKRVHAIIQSAKFKSGIPRGEKLKQQNRKRPAVAARKANALSGGDASKQTGEKRKLVSQTPDGALQNKKIRLQ